jgi:homoserine O-acetyltransferase
MAKISKLFLKNCITQNGLQIPSLPISYQVFGRELGTAPVVLVTHALTGNSNVAGKDGWWQNLIGEGKTIDLKHYTVLCFNVPGNGFDGFTISNYEAVSIADVAHWFAKGLEKLKIKTVFTGIGGSLGGAILWQMAVLKPALFQNLVPIASDWKATDWVIAQCRVQKQILENSSKPLYDARVHAMTFYRTPQSFRAKFNRSQNEALPLFNVESWLLHHGQKLEGRFQLASYKLMNHLLSTAKVETETCNFLDLASKIEGAIHMVGVDSDGLYTYEEIEETYSQLKLLKNNVYLAQLNSIHGHDAFLIEYEQLSKILDPIFTPENNLFNEQYYEHTSIG